MFDKKYQFVSIGGATRDFMFYDPQAKFIFTPKNLIKQKSLCFEYGAKVQVDETYITFGGGGANAAVNLANLGYSVNIVTSVGDDENSQAIVSNLQARGVDIKFIQRQPGKLAGFSFILTAGKEKEHVIFLYRGANNYLECKHPVLWKVKTKWFYITSISSNKWQEVLDCVYSQPGYKAWNPGGEQLSAGYKGLRKYLERTTVLALNKSEALNLAFSVCPKNQQKKLENIKNLLRILKKMGPQIVLVTSGREGADVYDGRDFYQQKVLGSGKNVKDTTGVGDCFDSTFVAGLEKYNFNIKKSLLAAAKNSASVITEIGAQNGLKKVF